MSALDFLFGGSAPASTTTYGTSTQNVPQWYSDYTQGLIAQANNIAATPYQPYPGPRVAGFTNNQNRAFEGIGDIQGEYKPTLNAAIGAATNAGNTDVTGAAMPYLKQAADLTHQTITDPTAMMNPYVSGVINNAGVLAGQNFSNYILPSLQGNFAKAGQYGSAGMQRAVGQQVNQTSQALQSQAMAALDEAYKNAQSAGLSGASQLGSLGSTEGNLAALEGQLGLGASQQLGSLASTGQTLGLQGNQALESVGNAQQQLNQTNLNTAYGDWQNQVHYPEGQLNWLSNLIRGQQMPTSTSSTGTTTSSAATPSTLSQIVGGIGNLTSAYNSIFGNG